MPIETVTQEHRPAGITAAAPCCARAASVLPDYRISVTRNDDTNGVVDMSLLIASDLAGIFGALKDEKLFNQACIELGALTWPDGAGLNPEWVHEEIGNNKMWSMINA